MSPEKKNDNTIPPSLESAPPEIKNEQSADKKCSLPDNATFQDAKNYLVCSTLITPREEKAYEYDRYVYRKELLGIATNVHLKYPKAQEQIKLSRLSSNTDTSETVNYSYHFLDVGLP